jgi:hypothetical protein
MTTPVNISAPISFGLDVTKPGKGHFRSVSIRAPGQVKGTRLFHLQSILDFISKCEQQGAVQ